MMAHSLTYLGLAFALGFVMAWSVGANDLANVMSPTMGSKAISVRQALIIAVIFEFAGALLGGHGVANTVRSGIINTNSLNHHPVILVYGMLGVLAASTTWMVIASSLGMPVSITQSIIGSIVGFGTVVLGFSGVHWHKTLSIAASWVTSPALAGISAYLLFKSVQHFILGEASPLACAKRYLPVYLFFVGLLLSIVTVLRVFEHFDAHMSTAMSIAVVMCSSVIALLLGLLILQRMAKKSNDEFVTVEKMFSLLVAFTACAMVFGHGSNDIAVSIGPIAAIFSLVYTHHTALNSNALFWILVYGCVGVVLGLFMYGRKVISTVGSGITALTPSRAFCATLAAAMTVIIATSNGIPVSTTQTLVGGVLGVGLARGIGALNLRIVRNIFMSWIVTLPVSATFCVIYYNLFHKLFVR